MNDTNNCKTDIINRALSLLREKEIVDAVIDPKTSTEKLVNKWWNTAVTECLIEIEPPFANTRQKLLKMKIVDPETLEEVQPTEEDDPSQDPSYIQKKNFGYLAQYRIPSDCLKMLNINRDNVLVEGEYIYSHEDNGLLLKYITSNTELYERETKFNIALAYTLAYYICADLQNTDNKIQLFLSLKEQKISEARTYYFRETGVKINRHETWRKRYYA